ncbi:transcription factor Adf-1-like [Ciona intestinalis]
MANKEFNETLINLVQANLNLYDSKHTHYKDSMRKQNTWSYISQQIGQPADVCMKRWRSLRDRFGKENKKIDSLRTSGAGAVNCIVWEHYDHLQFLNDHLRHRLTVGNVQPTVSDETDEHALLVRPFTSYESREDEEFENVPPSLCLPLFPMSSIVKQYYAAVALVVEKL